MLVILRMILINHLLAVSADRMAYVVAAVHVQVVDVPWAAEPGAEAYLPRWCWLHCGASVDVAAAIARATLCRCLKGDLDDLPKNRPPPKYMYLCAVLELYGETISRLGEPLRISKIFRNCCGATFTHTHTHSLEQWSKLLN